MITNKTNIFMMSSPKVIQRNKTPKRRSLEASIITDRAIHNYSVNDVNWKRTHGFTIGFHGMFEDNSLSKEKRK